METLFFVGVGMMGIGVVGMVAFALLKGLRTALLPFVVVLLGAVITAIPFVSNLINPEPRKDPIVRTEKGDVQLTITDAANFDYASLREYTSLSVLQMANKDVTDATLEHLRTMSTLKELDLNNTQITDAGLRILKDLPALEVLRLNNTKITDAGFREHLLGKESLMRLELTGTGVSKETGQEWRKGKAGRRVMQ